MPLWFHSPIISTKEQNLLEDIINFSLHLRTQDLCFDSLREKVDVIFSDDTPTRREQYRREEWESYRGNLIGLQDRKRTELDTIRDEFEQSRDPELEAKIGEVSSAIEHINSLLEEREPAQSSLLGEFHHDTPGKPRVIIYYDNILASCPRNLWLGLAGVFVHEMFHAWNYFQTSGTPRIREIDEPMVEFSATYFLKKLAESEDLKTPIEDIKLCIEWQLGSVRHKRFAFGITAAYGFGYYLFKNAKTRGLSSPPVWIEQYSKLSSSIQDSYFTEQIKESLAPIYNFSGENKVFNWFKQILLHNAVEAGDRYFWELYTC